MLEKEDQDAIFKHANKTSNIWLDEATLKNHKAEITPKYQYLMGDVLGPKPKISASHGSLETWTNWLIHDSIKLIEHLDNISIIPSKKLTMWTKQSLQEFKSIEATAFLPNMPRVADNINKDNILAVYTNSCQACSIEARAATTKTGETTPHSYPRRHQLIKKCTMHPNCNL
jgi:hypothetical protein